MPGPTAGGAGAAAGAAPCMAAGRGPRRACQQPPGTLTVRVPGGPGGGNPPEGAHTVGMDSSLGVPPVWGLWRDVAPQVLTTLPHTAALLPFAPLGPWLSGAWDFGGTAVFWAHGSLGPGALGGLLALWALGLFGALGFLRLTALYCLHFSGQPGAFGGPQLFGARGPLVPGSFGGPQLFGACSFWSAELYGAHSSMGLHPPPEAPQQRWGPSLPRLRGDQRRGAEF